MIDDTGRVLSGYDKIHLVPFGDLFKFDYYDFVGDFPPTRMPFSIGIPLAIAMVSAAGALFCLSVVVTGSLWLAVGCHFAWNLFEGPVFGFPVSGLSIGSAHIVSQSVNGPEWFTGGSFGPEAGASSLIALAVGAAILVVLHRRGAFAG